MILEASLVGAVVDAAFEGFLVEVGALMIEQIGFTLGVKIAHVAFPRFARVVTDRRT